MSPTRSNYWHVDEHTREVIVQALRDTWHIRNERAVRYDRQALREWRLAHEVVRELWHDLRGF